VAKKPKKSRSDLILDEAERLREEKKIVDVDEETIKLVFIKLSGKIYAFNGADIKEILRFEKITFVPGTSDYILGIINVRGEIESVIDLGKIIGLSKKTANISNITGRITLAEKDGIKTGIFVDSVEDMVDVPISMLKPPLSSLSKNVAPFVSGGIEHKGGEAAILDMRKIVAKLKDEQ